MASRQKESSPLQGGLFLRILTYISKLNAIRWFSTET